MMDSLSMPQNVSDQDLIAMSNAPNWLTELWMLDCPDITESGFLSLTNLKRLMRLQLHVRFAMFMTEDILKAFLRSGILSVLTLIFNSTEEIPLGEQILEIIPGSEEYLSILSQGMSIRSGYRPEISFNTKFIRGLIL